MQERNKEFQNVEGILTFCFFFWQRFHLKVHLGVLVVLAVRLTIFLSSISCAQSAGCLHTTKITASASAQAIKTLGFIV